MQKLDHPGGHFKRLCRVCLEEGRQTIIVQCRCIGSVRDKAVTFGLCAEHEAKLTAE